jgi:ion channel
MVEFTAVHLAVIAATFIAVALCVLLQYEALVFVWRQLGRRTVKRRAKVLYGILSVILVHTAEIVVFGATIWALLWWPETGELYGPEIADFFECVYLSAVTFSTVGFGDIAPVGPIRFLSATESLCGFVLITWSASFTYLEMEKFWREEEEPR